VRLGTTASIVTSSAAKTIQMVQFATAAIVLHGAPGSDSSITITGITSNAAMSTGISNRLAIRAARSSMPPSSPRR
jgi:hypothetical protein